MLRQRRDDDDERHSVYINNLQAIETDYAGSEIFSHLTKCNFNKPMELLVIRRSTLSGKLKDPSGNEDRNIMRTASDIATLHHAHVQTTQPINVHDMHIKGHSSFSCPHSSIHEDIL